LLGFLAGGHVPRDLRETAQAALRVLDRGDHDTGPETRSVLSHAPAFRVEAPLRARGREFVFVETAREILLRIKTREPLPDHFVGRVAAHPLRAFVPAH